MPTMRLRYGGAKPDLSMNLESLRHVLELPRVLGWLIGLRLGWLIGSKIGGNYGQSDRQENGARVALG